MEYFFTIAETCSIHKIAGCNHAFIVNEENGCWCVFGKEYADFVSAFIGTTICSSKLRLNNELFVVLRTLFRQGILKINNESLLVEKTNKQVDNHLTIILNTTNRCNIQCKYCYAFSGIREHIDFPSTSIIDSITKLVEIKPSQRISIVFHGGEPLLCWNKIVEMVTALDNRYKNVDYSIQTNGILIDKGIVDFAKLHSIKIGISLDGSNKQANINRFAEDKPGYLKKVISNIDLLVTNDVKPGVLTVITKENYMSVVDSIAYFASKGVQYFGFNFYLPKGRGANRYSEIVVDKFVDIYTKLACYINDYNAVREPKDYISERTVSVLIYSLSHKPLGGCFSTPCYAGNSLFAIDVNGDVYLCDEFLGDTDFCIGNVLNSEFSINKIEKTNTLADRDIVSIKVCNSCPIKKLCPFKCPSNSYYSTGDLYQPNGMCEFTKQVLPKFMYLLQSNTITSKYFIFY